MVQMAQVETISGKFQWAEDNRLKVIADLEVRDADCATLSEKVRMLEAQRSSDAEVHAQAIATLESQLSDIRAFMTSMQQEVASSAPSADQVKTSEECVCFASCQCIGTKTLRSFTPGTQNCCERETNCRQRCV